jgi:hypothetical protein
MFYFVIVVSSLTQSFTLIKISIKTAKVFKSSDKL